MLDEFSVAIKQFVPTIPEELKTLAESRLAEMTENTAMDEKAIQKVFYEIGVQEYPHRRAYNELTHSSAEQKMKDMVTEHVDEDVRNIIKPHLDSGVSLEALTASDIFENELSAEQRYQVTDGILVAKKKLAEVLKEEAGADADAYKKLLDKWTKQAEEIEAAIQKLEQFVEGGTEDQQSEIKSKAARFREGFLVTEQDPEMEHVQKEIEYWTDTFAEEE
jgi:cytochrome c556